ncbi:MAG: transporter substrate-binding domain-containing protein, partial [Bacilli bacterium]|nr:transporter substrate-binding domain-containing protein [Bacilli bacterium]
MTQMVAVNNNKGTYSSNMALNDTDAGTFKVGMECAYDPFNWTQADGSNEGYPIANVSGKYANGYDVQIARQVANHLHMKLEIYQYEWEGLLPAVQSGTIDGIVAGMSPTEERLKEIDFSHIYYQSNLVVITRKGNKLLECNSLQEIDKKGVKIAAQPGTFHLDALKAQTSNLTVV